MDDHNASYDQPMELRVHARIEANGIELTDRRASLVEA